MSEVTIIQVDPNSNCSPWVDPPIPPSASDLWTDDNESVPRPKFVSVLLVNAPDGSEIISEGDKSIIQLHAVGSTVSVLPEASDLPESHQLPTVQLRERTSPDATAGVVTITDTQWTTVSSDPDPMSEKPAKVRQVPRAENTPILLPKDRSGDQMSRSSQLIHCQVMDDNLMEYSGSWRELSTNMAQKHVMEKRHYVEILNGTSGVVISESLSGVQHSIFPTQQKTNGFFTDQGITLNVNHSGTTLSINGNDMYP